jgi:hypothetical protein
MFGMFSQQPQRATSPYQQVAMSTTPPLAGQSVYSQVLQEVMRQYPERVKKEGERTAADIFEDTLRQNTIQGLVANDPRVVEEQSRVYEGTMNRLADAANERAMKGHIFAGLLNLPNKWQEAMSEKYRFSGPMVDMIKQGSQRTTANPFTTRQYINI